MNIMYKLTTAVVGEDQSEVDMEYLATAGITLTNRTGDVSPHYNAIEIHARTLGEAQALRDEVLKRILAYKED